MSNTLTQSPYVNRFERLLEFLQTKLSKLDAKLNSIDDNHPDKQQSRLNVLEEINKTKQDIENTLKNLECSKTMSVIRSDQVTLDVADHNVWNDCWYDEERKAFVTHSKQLGQIPNARTRDIQIQYDKEMDSETGIILEEERIKFSFGYPSILREDQDNNPVWFMLPTLTDKMLTGEIVKARLRPRTHEESVLYETESEQWITIGTKGLSLCEKENEISDKLELYPKVPMEELKTLYNRK